MTLGFRTALKRLLGIEQTIAAEKTAEAAPPHLPGELHWQCNICGADNRSLAARMERETAECARCGSLMRYRAVALVLTKQLCGSIQILADVAVNRGISGIGMSDNSCYAPILEQKYDYTNTFYHCEPLLDIVQPEAKWLGSNDFIITTDVFEHVPPPIQPAFDNLYALLKPGGLLVFSVPFLQEDETREHFPNLYKYDLRQEAESGEWVLTNVTREGHTEVFRNLVFHDGDGLTLEMRLFSLAPIKRHLAAAGFEDVQVYGEPYFEYGIFWLKPWSLMISARRPR